MRSLNWNSITATSDEGGTRLPAGPYVARITDAIDYPTREYVEVVWDVAEGEHAGRFSDDWGREHAYAHHMFLSYKDRALGMLKGRLEAIGASNPGFDPFAAWDAGRLEMFRGRLVGINLQEEEYENKDGELRTRMAVCQVVDAQRVRDGKVQAREPKRLKGGGGTPATGGGRTATYEDTVDVPLD